MTKLKTRISDLKQICKLIKLEGKNVSGSNEQLIENMLMITNNDHIEIDVLSKTNVVLASLTYNLEIEEDGEIPIGSIEIFEQYLARFDGDDEIILEVLENKLKLLREKTEKSPEKTAYIPLTSKENIDDSSRAKNIIGKLLFKDNVWCFGNTKLPVEITIESESIKEVLADGDIKNITRDYPFVVNDKGLKITVGNEKTGQITTKLLESPFDKEIKSTYTNGIDNVFKGLNGEVNINMNENSPMLVRQSTEKYDIKYIIAPSK